MKIALPHGPTWLNIILAWSVYETTCLLYSRTGRDSSHPSRHGTSVRPNLGDTSALRCHDSADNRNDSRKNYVRQSRVQLPAHIDGGYHASEFSCSIMLAAVIKNNDCMLWQCIVHSFVCSLGVALSRWQSFDVPTAYRQRWGLCGLDW